MNKGKLESATFGAGCFWHVEEAFNKISGVVKTEVGYMGGNEKKYPNPTYEQVCSDESGFAEVVHVKFDPQKVSYEKLVDAFFRSHDPTQFHKQGPDVGSQYRSVIFYHNEEQKKLAEKSLKKYQSMINKKIVTKIAKAGKFFRAEDYHQKYFEKHPLVCKVTNLFGGK